MVRVYDSDDLKKYIAQGEKVFEAGNKKMEVAFKVYDALGPSKASTLTPSMYEGMVAGALSEVAVIACNCIGNSILYYNNSGLYYS